MEKVQASPCLQLHVTTWHKDSHGLYDYQATNTQKQYFEIRGPCKIFRDWIGGATQIVSNQSLKKGCFPDQPFVFLTSISLRTVGHKQKFYISPPQKPSQILSKKDMTTDQIMQVNTNSYLVVRYYKDAKKPVSGYPIQTGNILKLGRVQYKVVEMGNIPKMNHKKQQSFFTQFNGVHKVDYEKTGICKFCLCDQVTEDNCLISPCKCSGSCEGVHVDCLRHWIDSKVKKEVFGVVMSYNFTKFECQICKYPFPRFIIKGEKQLQTITILKPERPYLILEGINQRNQSKQQRCLHVICPQQNGSAKMGRAHHCDIKLQDISVSRQHAEIKYEDGDFYINDLNSKFGTLSMIQSSMEVNNRLKLQCGRSFYQFQLS